MSVRRIRVLASAGTGKTYQLVGRFIEWVESGVDPARILATTFTRKAAGEIQERILRRLAGDPKDGEPARPKVLRRVVDAFGSLAIGTLDSLADRIARSRPFEVDLVPDWGIGEEEIVRMQSEAIEQALEEGDHRVIFELIRLLQKGGGSRSVHARIVQVVQGASDAYRQTRERPEVWGRVGPRTSPLSPEELDAVLDRIEGLELPRTGKGEPNKTWWKANCKAVDRAREEDWEGVVGAGLGAKILEGEEKFSRCTIEQEVVDAYRPLLDHAVAGILQKLAGRNRAICDLMERFDRAFRQRKAARRSYEYADISEALLAVPGWGAGTGGWSGPGGGFEHVQLDEFQDTSIDQFGLLEAVLGPVVLEEEGGGVFCVGDLKQSLYGWRGAVPSLLAGLAERWPGLEPESLDLNRRSSGVVIEAVNRVFESLDGNPALGEDAETAARWAEGYQRHEAHQKIGGEVHLLTGPSTDGRSGPEQRYDCLLRAAQRVDRLVRRAPGASVAVLVRRRESVRIVRTTLERLGIAASEEGGNPLLSARPVERVADLLQLTWYPGDSAAAYRVATSPLGSAVGLGVEDDPERRRRFASGWRRRFFEEGFVAPLQDLLAQVSGHMDREELGRFEQLVQLAIRYDERGEWRAREFLMAIRDRPIEDPGREQVRVMTLHAAKGLEFDCVVLPELERSLSPRPDAVLVHRPDPFGPVDWVTSYPNQALCAIDPDLARIHADWRAGKVYDELCGIYVSMTRAVHCLEMIVPASHPGRQFPGSAAGILRAALAPETELVPDAELWCRVEGDWEAEVAEREARRPAEPELERVELRLQRGGGIRPGILLRSTPSRRLEGPVDLASLFESPTRDGRDPGRLIHAWFEEVAWLEEGRPGSAALLEMAADLGFGEGAARVFLERFEASLNSPEIVHLLSRERFEAERLVPELGRERPFAVLVDDDPGLRLSRGRYDRIVVARDRAGAVRRVEIVDLKTDSLAGNPEGLAPLVERYRPQLDAYRRAAAAQYDLELAAVTGWFLFASPGRVVEVTR